MARPIELRDSVKWFASQMERKLKNHDDRPGWEDQSIRWLYERLDEETGELLREINRLLENWSKTNIQRVVSEAADVANFAMMIADNADRSK